MESELAEVIDRTVTPIPLENHAAFARQAVERLVRSRIVLVTGKGGTGKTSLAAALGQVLARRGNRALIVEVDAQQPAFKSLFGIEPGYEPVPVTANLSICNLDWHSALREWLEHTVPIQRITRLILSNRMVRAFLDATPGARELVLLSKIVSLGAQWDHVVVDLPASGHAVGLLRVPRVALRLMGTGPIRQRSVEILDAFAATDTRLVVMALPEEMVINETVELVRAVTGQVPELRHPVVVLNRASKPTLTADELTLLDRLEARCATSESAREVLRAGRWEAEQERATRIAIERIRDELGAEPVILARLGGLGGLEPGEGPVVEQMAAALGRLLLAPRSTTGASDEPRGGGA